MGLRVGFQLDDSLGDRAGDKAWALHSLFSSDLALPSKWGLTQICSRSIEYGWSGLNLVSFYIESFPIVTLDSQIYPDLLAVEEEDFEN